MRRGEVYGFVGPNGAGKSATIRTLLDLIRPTAGSIRVLGADPRTAGAELRRRLGYLPGELPFSADRPAPISWPSRLGCAVAGDEEVGILDVYLAHPLARRRLVIERFAAVTGQILFPGW